MTATGGASGHGRNINHYCYQDYIELVLREFANLRCRWKGTCTVQDSVFSYRMLKKGDSRNPQCGATANRQTKNCTL